MSDVPQPLRTYAVTLISDTHFDEEPWERYRKDWVPPSDSRVPQDHRRNLDMWRERMPRLLAAAADLARREPTVFALHLGDIVHGFAADAESLTRMLRAGERRVRDAFGELPVYLLVGNHDVLSPDGVEAYLAWARRPLNRVFRKGPDAWILVDTDRPPALPDLKALFQKAEGARWTFFLTHRPAFPFNGAVGYNFLYDAPEQTDCRHALRRLLAERRAVVLAAHVHSLIHTVFDFPEGRVTQFVLSSLWEREDLATINFRTVPRGKWCKKTKMIPEGARAAFAALASEHRPHLALHR